MIVSLGFRTTAETYSCQMKSLKLRSLVLLFAGLSVSIVPVRAFYALTTQGASTSRSASFLPRSQQRIRLVSMRVVTAASARAAVRCAPHVSPPATVTRCVKTRSYVRPLRC
jgi:hypothetical protein